MSEAHSGENLEPIRDEGVTCLTFVLHTVGTIEKEYLACGHEFLYQEE